MEVNKYIPMVIFLCYIIAMVIMVANVSSELPPLYQLTPAADNSETTSVEKKMEAAAAIQFKWPKFTLSYHPANAHCTYILLVWFFFNEIAKKLDLYTKFFCRGPSQSVQFYAQNIEGMGFWIQTIINFVQIFYVFEGLISVASVKGNLDTLSKDNVENLNYNRLLAPYAVMVVFVLILLPIYYVLYWMSNGGSMSMGNQEKHNKVEVAQPHQPAVHK